MDITQVISDALSALPDKIDAAGAWITELLPSQAGLLDWLKFAALFLLAVFAAGVLIKALFGRRSNLNRALSCAIGILMIYLVTAAVYTWRLDSFQAYLAPLPFVLIQGGRMIFMPIRALSFPELCQELLGLFILSFCINMMDSLIPLGRKAISWLLSRALVIVLSMGLHLLLRWACNTFLPGVLVAYAPAILVGILVGLLLMGVLNVLLSLVLTAVNPILGGIYAFFFSSHVGKQISKSVLSTVFLTAVFCIGEALGFQVFVLTPENFLSALPIACVLPFLWYVLGHIF